MSHPIPFETLVAYWAHELSVEEADVVEEHVMACAACTTASERIAVIATTLRAVIPPIVSLDRVEKLRENGARIVENRVTPGERRPVVFASGIDVLLHRLGGLDLAITEHVTVTVRDDDTGVVLTVHPHAPFMRDTGEILVACQRHFAAFPPNVRFDVEATTRTGSVTRASYVVPHTFEAAR